MQGGRGAQQRLQDHGDLRANADRIQDQERAVAQPVQGPGNGVELLERKVRVPDHLGRAPGRQHRAVPAAAVERGEGQADAPHEHQAAGDLHRGREEGGRDDSCKKNKRVSIHIHRSIFEVLGVKGRVYVSDVPVMAWRISQTANVCVTRAKLSTVKGTKTGEPLK